MPFFALQYADAKGAPQTLWLTAQPGVSGIWDEGNEDRVTPKRNVFAVDDPNWPFTQFFPLGSDSQEVLFTTIGTFAGYEAADDWRTAFLGAVPSYGRLVRMRRRGGVTTPTWAQWYCDGAFLDCKELDVDHACSIKMQYKALLGAWTPDTDWVPSLQGIGLTDDSVSTGVGVGLTDDSIAPGSGAAITS